MFQQKRLRFSGWQTDKNYRLFRKSKVRFSNKRIVHETLEVDGTSAILNEKLTHYCYKNFSNYKHKMLLYGRMKAQEAVKKGQKFNYVMLFAKPIFTFSYNFIIRLGFLDGLKGVKVCYLNALGDCERFLELRKLEKNMRI